MSRRCTAEAEDPGRCHREAAAQDFSTIFTQHRVYVLVLPASRLATDADADADRTTNTAIPRLSADSSNATTVLTDTPMQRDEEGVAEIHRLLRVEPA